jgi:hypothetical protein
MAAKECRERKWQDDEADIFTLHSLAGLCFRSVFGHRGTWLKFRRRRQIKVGRRPPGAPKKKAEISAVTDRRYSIFILAPGF